MIDTKWWLVCYDVHDPDRLRKCAKHMEGYGVRVQYSVFRCWMTRREVERLRVADISHDARKTCVEHQDAKRALRHCAARSPCRRRSRR